MTRNLGVQGEDILPILWTRLDSNTLIHFISDKLQTVYNQLFTVIMMCDQPGNEFPLFLELDPTLGVLGLPLTRPDPEFSSTSSFPFHSRSQEPHTPGRYLGSFFYPPFRFHLLDVATGPSTTSTRPEGLWEGTTPSLLLWISEVSVSVPVRRCPTSSRVSTL